MNSTQSVNISALETVMSNLQEELSDPELIQELIANNRTTFSNYEKGLMLMAILEIDEPTASQNDKAQLILNQASTILNQFHESIFKTQLSIAI